MNERYLDPRSALACAYHDPAGLDRDFLRYERTPAPAAWFRMTHNRTTPTGDEPMTLRTFLPRATAALHALLDRAPTFDEDQDGYWTSSPSARITPAQFEQERLSRRLRLLETTIRMTEEELDRSPHHLHSASGPSLASAHRDQLRSNLATERALVDQIRARQEHVGAGSARSDT